MAFHRLLTCPISNDCWWNAIRPKSWLLRLLLSDICRVVTVHCSPTCLFHPHVGCHSLILLVLGWDVKVRTLIGGEAELRDDAHHINELGDGQSELDADGLVQLLHGTNPLLVASKEVLEQLVLCFCIRGEFWNLWKVWNMDEWLKHLKTLWVTEIDRGFSHSVTINLQSRKDFWKIISDTLIFSHGSIFTHWRAVS